MDSVGARNRKPSTRLADYVLTQSSSQKKRKIISEAVCSTRNSYSATRTSATVTPRMCPGFNDTPCDNEGFVRARFNGYRTNKSTSQRVRKFRYELFCPKHMKEQQDHATSKAPTLRPKLNEPSEQATMQKQVRDLEHGSNLDDSSWCVCCAQLRGVAQAVPRARISR